LASCVRQLVVGKPFTFTASGFTSDALTA
jgi:hypothetical protein